MKKLLVLCTLLLAVNVNAADLGVWEDTELFNAVMKGDARMVETRAIENAMEVYRLRNENLRLLEQIK